MTAPTRSRSSRRARPEYVPPQHGAWAFLGLPLVLGALLAPVTWLLAPLAVAWVGAYPLSYAALGLVRGRQPERYRAPLVVWSVVVLPSAALLVVARPWLLVVGVGYLLLFGVNAVFARRRDERALANDLVLIVECSAMVLVAGSIGSPVAPWSTGVPAEAWLLTAACALVLVGSTLHVKSLIRERADERYAAASRMVAIGSIIASLAGAAAWGLPAGLWLVVPFVGLAVRAYLIPGRSLRPGVIGMVELTMFVLLVICAALALWR